MLRATFTVTCENLTQSHDLHILGSNTENVLTSIDYTSVTFAGPLLDVTKLAMDIHDLMHTGDLG